MEGGGRREFAALVKNKEEGRRGCRGRPALAAIPATLRRRPCVWPKGAKRRRRTKKKNEDDDEDSGGGRQMRGSIYIYIF